MHVITFVAMIGVLIGSLLSEHWLATIAACIGLGLCCVTDGLYFIGKRFGDKQKGDSHETSSI